MLYYSMPALAAGFILDLMIGDPRWLYHPVCLIGNLIAFLEKILRKIFPKTDKGELAAGTVEVILVCLLSGGIPFLILHMTEEGVTKAAVETVAENASDGVIAPMLYMAIGGVWLMFLYKGINTMDSMLGYKNDKYLYFGRCAAKLDDVANYIPARLSGWLMVAASAFVKMDVKNAAKIYRRDRRNHASPNSAQTEAAMAGALEVQLAGNAYYFGKLYEKPTIGDGIRPVEVEDIRRSNRLLYATAILGAVIFLLIGSAVRYCFFL